MKDRHKPAKPKFVLRRLPDGDRPRYYRTIVDDEIVLTPDVYKAVRYSSREEAYASEVVERSLIVLHAEEMP